MVVDNKRINRRDVLRAAGATAGLVGLAGVASGQGADRVEVNVGYSRPSGRRAARSEAERVHREFAFDAMTITVSREGARRLERRGDIRYVEENGEMRALAQTLPWGVDRVDAEVAHANGETGSGADVAIIDTGIDDDHPDLQANVGAGRAFVGCRGPNCNHEWSDDNDHGTHCAGIADAVDNSEGAVGVSTEATLHAVKVLDKRGSGSFSDVAAGIEYTADQGWDVGSLSLGASSGSQTVKDACQYANDNGVLLVAAAGNSGPCSDCVGYPAAYSTVMAVSSTADDDSLSGFSSTGPEVEIAAPGSAIYSTVIGGYDTFSGTSMACPHVSGAGGQLMASGASNTQARDTLTSSAEDVGLASNESGAGLLDVAASLGLDSSDDLGGDANDAPTVGSLDATELETSDSDAEFDVDWSVSDADDNLSSVDLTLTDDTDGETEDTASISVSGGSASGTTRLVATGDDGSGNSYTVDCTVSDSDGATGSSSTSVGETEDTNSAPTVDSLSATEVETSDSDAEFDVDWSASDSDGNLDSVDLTLSDDTDTETEDSASITVSGDTASGTTRLVAAADDGSGNSYTVEAVVTDVDGASDSATTAVDETEDTSGDTAPTVDTHAISEAGSPNPHLEISVDWGVSDGDGDLTLVEVSAVNADGEAFSETHSHSVGGSSASGTDSFKFKHADGETADVTITVDDAAGNTDSHTEQVTE